MNTYIVKINRIFIARVNAHSDAMRRISDHLQRKTFRRQEKAYIKDLQKMMITQTKEKQ